MVDTFLTQIFTAYYLTKCYQSKSEIWFFVLYVLSIVVFDKLIKPQLSASIVFMPYITIRRTFRSSIYSYTIFTVTV